ncbi:hypothetical protein EDB89DRAFT_269380 [Lactarius sanguifluus]|nr:hypothetical protein EDB89DRAFT_269380 [Lactarius sanguifluus]
MLNTSNRSSQSTLQSTRISQKKGVAFCDIIPLFRNPLAFEALVTHFVHHLVSNVIPNSIDKKIGVIVALDSREFLLGLAKRSDWAPHLCRSVNVGNCQESASGPRSRT